MPYPTGWHSRNYLPHFDSPGAIQSVIFRLYDSVPELKLRDWLGELSTHPNEARDKELRIRIENYMDECRGRCDLRDERIGNLVENALLFFDSTRYRMIAWCVMPNHVHALMETNEGWPLAGILQSWKSFSSKEANRILSRTGSFWAREYFDRWIRDAQHFDRALAYIEDNPVKAGLVSEAKDWRFGSAWWRNQKAGE